MGFPKEGKMRVTKDHPIEKIRELLKTNGYEVQMGKELNPKSVAWDFINKSLVYFEYKYDDTFSYIESKEYKLKDLFPQTIWARLDYSE